MRLSSFFFRSCQPAFQCATLLAIVPVLVPAAKADPIVYTLSGNFSGSLGSQAFNGPITFQLISDTNDVQNLDGYSINTGGVSTITVNGQTATFLSKSFGVEAEYFSLAFLDTASFDFAANVFNTDASADALGQAGISLTGSYNSLLTGTAQTSLGALQLTGADGDVTFQTVGSTITVTPEPSSLILLGTGLLGCYGLLRRRFKTEVTT